MNVEILVAMVAVLVHLLGGEVLSKNVCEMLRPGSKICGTIEPPVKAGGYFCLGVNFG
jgi:hypothetical protein